MVMKSMVVRLLRVLMVICLVLGMQATPAMASPSGEGQDIRWRYVKDSFAIDVNDTLYAIAHIPGLLQEDGSIKERGSVREPLKIAEDVKDVLKYDQYAFYLKNDNSLWGWGDNGICGYLGDGATMLRETPVPIADDVATLPAPAHVGLFYTSMFFRKMDGTLWTWGSDGLMAEEKDVVSGEFTLAPVLADTDYEVYDTVPYDASDSFSSASTMLRDPSGTLYKWYRPHTTVSWGGAEKVEEDQSKVADPHIVVTPFMTDVKKILSPDEATSYVLKNDGSLWGWGDNSVCQLGNGTNTDQEDPISIIDSVVDFTVACSGNGITVFAIRADATLWAWGVNDTGYGSIQKYRLGDGTQRKFGEIPKQIMEDVVSVSELNPASREGHMLAVKRDGTMWEWGGSETLPQQVGQEEAY